MDKHNVEHACRGILSVIEGNEVLTAWCTMDDPNKYYANSNGSNAKSHVLHDSIYIKHPGLINPWSQKANWWLPRLRTQGNGK